MALSFQPTTVNQLATRMNSTPGIIRHALHRLKKQGRAECDQNLPRTWIALP